MTYDFVLLGRVPSKKNQYRRRVRSGLYKDKALRLELDRLAFQIPAEVRGLKLINPEMEFTFNVPSNGNRADRDGKLTTLLDILVEQDVLAGDNIGRCNGLILICPGRKASPEHATRVKIFPCSGRASA